MLHIHIGRERPCPTALRLSGNGRQRITSPVLLLGSPERIYDLPKVTRSISGTSSRGTQVTGLRLGSLSHKAVLPLQEGFSFLNGGPGGCDCFSGGGCGAFGEEVSGRLGVGESKLV